MQQASVQGYQEIQRTIVIYWHRWQPHHALRHICQMKIGLVTKEYSQARGGLEKYTFSLSRQILCAGHEVHVFANKWQADANIFFHKVPMVPFLLPLKNLSFAYFAKKRLEKVSLDVVHSMERILYQDVYRASDGIVPIHLDQRYPNPVVRRVKALSPRRLSLSYLEKMIFCHKRAKIIMTNSHLVRHQIIKYYHVHPERIRVIYNGIDTARFSPHVRDVHRESIRAFYDIREGEILLLFISNDHKRKGLMNLLKAIQLLRNKKFRLMVVGERAGKTHGQWIKRNIPGDRVLFVGPTADVERFYAASDIFVFPTRYDAFANVCLEAMACGLPVITTVNNGACELLEDGKEGFVLKRGDPDELEIGINALESPTERLRMGKNAADKAKGFTIQKNCLEVLDLYREVLDRRRH